MEYFQFTTGGAATDITVRTSNPALVLYANSYTSISGDTVLPNSTTGGYTWTSLTDTTQQNVLIIPGNYDPSKPNFVIGVLSKSSAVSFSITASSSAAVLVRGTAVCEPPPPICR